MYSKLGRYDRYLFCWPIAVIVFVSSITRTAAVDVSVNASALTCGASHLTFKYASSDYTYQSGTSSIIIASPLDPASDFVCGCGSGYDRTGINCYSLKCPSQNAYEQPRTPYGNPYGGRQPYGQGPQAGPYGAGDKGNGISVGALVGSIETTYPCWKLKQMRLNTYVYLVCFVHEYYSQIYEIQFKDNYQLTLSLVETIPSNYVSSVARVTHTTEYGMTCLLATFSTFCDHHKADFLRSPSDCLGHLFYICPNNYKWKFCGSVPLVGAVDVSLINVQNAPILISAQLKLDHAAGPSGARGLPQVLSQGGSVMEMLALDVDVERGYCKAKGGAEVVVNIGCLPVDGGVGVFLPVCGLTKINWISHGNLTMVAASVNDLLCLQIPVSLEGWPAYSSFIMLYDVLKRKFLIDKVVFLGNANHATDIQYVKGGSDSDCQYVSVTSTTGAVKFYCLSAIVAALHNATTGSATSCVDHPPVVIPPLNTGGNGPVFPNAHSCSFKAKCCNSDSTCMTCTRPAKYGDLYLAELKCGSKQPKTDNDDDYDSDRKAKSRPNKNPYIANYDENVPQIYGGNMGGGNNMRNGSYGMQFGMGNSGAYGGGRPGNYSGNAMGGGPVYGPQQGPQQGGHYYGQPHPYGAPPMPYQQQIYQG